MKAYFNLTRITDWPHYHHSERCIFMLWSCADVEGRRQRGSCVWWTISWGCFVKSPLMVEGLSLIWYLSFIAEIYFQVHVVNFPIIAQMAQDYLAIPTTSVMVEQVFSKSCHICSNLHSLLKEKTITMALLTKVWIWNGLFDMTPPKEICRKHGDNGEK